MKYDVSYICTILLKVTVVRILLNYMKHAQIFEIELYNNVINIKHRICSKIKKVKEFKILIRGELNVLVSEASKNVHISYLVPSKHASDHAMEELAKQPKIYIQGKLKVNT
jgi:hypothetical protein